MEGLGWIILIVVILLFGKNIPFIAALENGTFFQPNAVPNPNGTPAITLQNQTSPPENQPAPWKSVCGTPISAPSPTNVYMPLNMSPISFSNQAIPQAVQSKNNIILGSSV